MSWQSNLKKRLENNKIKSKQQLLLFDSDKIDILSYVKITNDKGIASITVANNKGSTLPETGGIGNYVFYGVGGVLMMGAAYYFGRKRTGKNI